MRTRKEAEARAMELYPDPHIPDRIGITVQDLIDRSNAYHKASALRQAFLQCWDEMQDNKLHEAAEKVVLVEKVSELKTPHRLKVEIKKLEKALK